MGEVGGGVLIHFGGMSPTSITRTSKLLETTLAAKNASDVSWKTYQIDIQNGVYLGESYREATVQ
jgi:hypothetical protein